MNQYTLSGFTDEISPVLAEQLSVMKELNLHYMECRGVDGKNLIEYSNEQIQDIKKLLTQSQVKLSALGSPIGKIDITEDFEPHFMLFKHAVEAAHIMETPNIRLFSFYIPEGEHSRYESEVFRRTEQMVEYAIFHKVILMHENEKGIYGDNAQRCLNLMERFYCDHYKAVFDFANFVQVGQDTLEAYEMLSPYIYYIHIKDALFSDGSVVPAGYGDGNVKQILSSLIKNGYNGFLSLEPHLSEFTGFSSLEKNIAAPKCSIPGQQAFLTAYNALIKLLTEIK